MKPISNYEIVVFAIAISIGVIIAIIIAVTRSSNRQSENQLLLSKLKGKQWMSFTGIKVSGSKYKIGAAATRFSNQSATRSSLHLSKNMVVIVSNQKKFGYSMLPIYYSKQENQMPDNIIQNNWNSISIKRKLVSDGVKEEIDVLIETSTKEQKEEIYKALMNWLEGIKK